MKKSEMLDELRAKVMDLIVSHTEKCRKAHEITGDPEDIEFSRDMSVMIDRVMGGNKSEESAAFIRLFTKYSSRKFIEMPSRWELRHGVAIVPLSNPNSHNYPIGRVSIACGRNGHDPVAIRPDGQYGNGLPRQFTALRMATPEEIDAYLKNLNPNGLWEVVSLLCDPKKSKLDIYDEEND